MLSADEMRVRARHTRQRLAAGLMPAIFKISLLYAIALLYMRCTCCRHIFDARFHTRARLASRRLCARAALTSRRLQRRAGFSRRNTSSDKAFYAPRLSTIYATRLTLRALHYRPFLAAWRRLAALRSCLRCAPMIAAASRRLTPYTPRCVHRYTRIRGRAARI